MTKIAILSDSHDNIGNLQKALAQIAASQADMLLHCGDLCAPFIIATLGDNFAGPIHIIFGNNDADGRLLHALSMGYEQMTLHGIYAELTIANRTLAMIHYPEPALRIAQSGAFDLVCYGHNHLKKHEMIGDCHLVNPGEILGMKGEPTWGLYDCEMHEFSLQEIDKIS